MTVLPLVSASGPAATAPFDRLSAEARRSLIGIATVRSFERGEVIVAQGAIAASFYVLLEGRAKRVRDLAAGRSLVLALLGPGDPFATVAALAATPSDAGVVALGPLRALEIARESLLELVAGRPRLLGELLPMLLSQMAECRNCIVELSGARVEQRLAALLSNLAESAGEAVAHAVRLPIRLSRQELADLAATRVETAIRVLSAWQKQGFVETLPDGFLIVAPERLRAIASGRRDSA